MNHLMIVKYAWIFAICCMCCSMKVFAQKNNSYWQQEVNYRIAVTLNDETNILSGNISISYTNHSPDTLQYIWFHLWPNAYKNNNTAYARQELQNGNTDFYFASDEDRGYIDSLQFTIDNAGAANYADTLNPDIMKLLLNTPLLPGQTILIATPFRVKIPKTFSRFGHVGQSYQVTQWYPKPAVYDRFGWHQMPYLNQGEFYSEFGSFDVQITLPRNYVVGATGIMKDDKEYLWLDSLNLAARKEFDVQQNHDGALPASPFAKNKSAEKFPPSDQQLKTLEFFAGHVHDFAWFADKRYHVMKSSVQLPGKEEAITTWTMFLDAHTAQWKHAINFVDSSIFYYSKWIGDYPYPQATAVEGALIAGDGMEYPMITVISGGFSRQKALETVIAHEVGHNWFYGILAFNEREHPWMDEGINSYYENRYIEKRYPGDGLLNNVLAKPFDLTSYKRGYQNYLLYVLQAYRHLDQPLDINSTDFTQLNYGAMVYAKTAIEFDYLASFLGTALYDSLMQRFYQEWSFRHSYPEDLANFFEEATHKELDWFFRQSIETAGYLDYKLAKTGDTTIIGHSIYRKLKVVNKGDIKGPFSISALYNQKEVATKWYGGFNGKMEVLFPEGNYDAYRLDANMELPEVNRKNNTVHSSGLLPNIEKPRLQWLGSIDNPQRTQLFYTPVAGWNNYDKFWLGMAFYNTVLPGKPFSFVLMPAYGFGSNKIVGLGEINLQLFPKKSFIRRIDITSTAKSFDYANQSYFGTDGDQLYRFRKFTQQIELGIRKPFARSLINQSITARNIYFWNDTYSTTVAAVDPAHRTIIQVTYAFQNKRIIQPFAFSISLEQGIAGKEDHYLKTYLEGNYMINYPRKKTGAELRLFTGWMIAASEGGSFGDFYLGATTGAKDYLFDNLYFGRTETSGFLSQQVTLENGGFKIRTDGVQPELGKSDTWLIAFNAKVPLPILTPLFVFGDAGIAPDQAIYQSLQYDAGIGLTLLPHMIEIYLPLIFSNDMKLNLNTTAFYDQWYKRITFTIQLNQLNPFKQIRTISL